MKHYIKESKNFLTEKNINFIENVLLNGNFPLFFTNLTVYGESRPSNYLLHIVQNRIENTTGSIPFHKLINSPFYEDTIDILNNFCKSVNQKPFFFARITYNFTYNNGTDKVEIHQDHEYDHKQIVIYLNDADIESTTSILDKKNKLIKEISPIKYTGVCFENLPHFQKMPKYGHRFVLVATFI